MTYFMSPAPNHWRRHPRGPRPRKLQPRGPNPKPNASQPNFPPIFASCEMLRHDILGRYILSRPNFRGCAPSHYPTYACMFEGHPYIAAHAGSLGIHARARERSRNVSASHPAPVLGRGPGFDTGAQPPGDPRYAGHHRRIGESAGGRSDPELSRGVLSDYPRLSPVAADAAGSLPTDGPGVLHG